VVTNEGSAGGWWYRVAYGAVLVAAGLLSVLATGADATAAPACLDDGTTTTCTFSAVLRESWVVPPRVSSIAVEAYGGNGAPSDQPDDGGGTVPGGRGARVTSTIAVTAGQELSVIVGRAGSTVTTGGGASAVQLGTTWLLVAGAGGGAGGGGDGRPGGYGGDSGSAGFFGARGALGGVGGEPGPTATGGSGGQFDPQWCMTSAASGQAGASGSISTGSQLGAGGSGGFSAAVRGGGSGGDGGEGYVGGGGGGAGAWCQDDDIVSGGGGGGGGSSLGQAVVEAANDGVVNGGAGLVRIRFATPPPLPPAAATGAVSAVTAVSALVAGSVQPGSGTATPAVEYGRTTAYGSRIELAALPAGDATIAVAATLSGLQPGATYHYRVVAASAFGTAVGTDGSFTTESTVSATSRVSARWKESRLRGTIIVRGHVVGSTGEVLAELRSGARVLRAHTGATGRDGSFTLAIPLPARLLPGRYTVHVRAPGGGTTRRVVSIPAPSEGVVRSAGISGRRGANPAVRLPHGRLEIWARFVFAVPPRHGPVLVRWSAPAGLRKDVSLPRRRLVESYVGNPASGRVLPRGRYRATLIVQGLVVARTAVVIR
jgi:hypothetical protein